MSASYQHMSLAEVRPGMVLSDVLLDKQGQVLLPEGAVLTEAVIALLPRHGIDMLPIVRLDLDPADAADAAAQRVERAVRVAHLFRRHDADDDSDWATGVLRRYVEDYRLNREIADE